jgi:hypothetical protein
MKVLMLKLTWKKNSTTKQTLSLEILPNLNQMLNQSKSEDVMDLIEETLTTPETIPPLNVSPLGGATGRPKRLKKAIQYYHDQY